MSPGQKKAIAAFDTSRQTGTKVTRNGDNDSCSSASNYRGSVLLWTQDTVAYCYDPPNLVTNSSGWQDSGAIFPNTAANDGIWRYQTDPNLHRWSAKDTAGAGVPTPWGAVNVYHQDVINDFWVNGEGSWQWTNG